MSASLYHVSVPLYTHFLTSLARIIDKAAAHSEAKKIKPEALLAARLFPDMWSFAEQVRATCNHATRGPATTAYDILRHNGVPLTKIDLVPIS
jgi:hypothetical protein